MRRDEVKKKVGFLIFILYSTSLLFIGILYTIKKVGLVIIEKQQSIEKNQKLFSIIASWINKKQQGKSMEVFLEKNAYHSIAIYGLGTLGKLLEMELNGYIEISYAIDQREISAAYPVYKPEDMLPEVDAVIVTAVYEFEKIEEILKKKLECPIYSIEDIICFMEIDEKNTLIS